MSYGLLVRAPEGASVGDDVADLFGVEHYEPNSCMGIQKRTTGGDAEQVPDNLRTVAKYDVDSLRRYSRVFTPGELVMVTEKIHGANSRYCFSEDRMWCGSRSEWKKKQDGSIWWRALEVTPQIEEFCRAHPGFILYGEVYGKVQELRYGVENDVRFAAFDVLGPSGAFFPALFGRAVTESSGVPCVPLYRGEMPFDFAEICEMAEGPSRMEGANHVREGVVVKPVEERWHQSVGRVILKVVGSGYLKK